MLRLVTIFLTVLFLATHKIGADETSVIDQIKAGDLSATSPELGRLWFQENQNRDEAFKNLLSWAYSAEAEAMLAAPKGVLLSSTPQYCFDNRQPRLTRYHIDYLKEASDLTTYRREIELVHEALGVLRNEIESRAKLESAKIGGSSIAKEIIRRAALSKTTEGRNAILFEFGYNERLSDRAWYLLQEMVILNLCEYDYDNTEWAKKLLEDNGWPSLKEHGIETDARFALLIRRAYDFDFKAKLLEQLPSIYTNGDISIASFELLTSQTKTIEKLNTQFANRRVFMCHAP